jgi:hypothetical protein
MHVFMGATLSLFMIGSSYTASPQLLDCAKQCRQVVSLQVSNCSCQPPWQPLSAVTTAFASVHLLLSPSGAYHSSAAGLAATPVLEFAAAVAAAFLKLLAFLIHCARCFCVTLL